MDRTRKTRKDSEETVNVNIPLAARLHARIKATAALEGRTLQDWIRAALDRAAMTQPRRQPVVTEAK